MEVADHPYQVGAVGLGEEAVVGRRRRQEVVEEVEQVRYQVGVEDREEVAVELQRPHRDLAVLVSHQLKDN